MSIIVYGVYKRREKQGPLNCTWLNMVNICTKYVCLALCIRGLPKDTWLSDRFDPWYCPSAAANLIQLNSHDCWLWIIYNQTIISGPSSTQNVLLIRQEHQTSCLSQSSMLPHTMDTELIFSEFSQFYFGPVFFLLGKGTEEFRMMGSRLFMYCRSDLARMGLLVTGISWLFHGQKFTKVLVGICHMECFTNIRTKWDISGGKWSFNASHDWDITTGCDVLATTLG